MSDININTGIGMIDASGNKIYVNGKRINSSNAPSEHIGKIVDSGSFSHKKAPTDHPVVENSHKKSPTVNETPYSYSMGTSRPFLDSVTAKPEETLNFDFRDPSQPNIGTVTGAPGCTMTFNF